MRVATVRILAPTMDIHFIQAKKEGAIICHPEEIKNMLIEVIVKDVTKNSCVHFFENSQ